MGSAAQDVTPLVIRRGDEGAYEEGRRPQTQAEPNARDGVSASEYQLPKWGTGRVEVQALDPDGSPLSGVYVNLDRATQTETNADGVAVFETVGAGAHAIALPDIGYLPASQAFTMEEGEIIYLQLREPKGGELDLEVVDASGRPLPFARFECGLPGECVWLEMEDGVFRADAFTDERGRRHLSRVAPGERTWTAYWGDKRGQASVGIQDLQRSRLEIVVR